MYLLLNSVDGNALYLVGVGERKTTLLIIEKISTEIPPPFCQVG